MLARRDIEAPKHNVTRSVCVFLNCTSVGAGVKSGNCNRDKLKLVFKNTLVYKPDWIYWIEYEFIPVWHMCTACSSISAITASQLWFVCLPWVCLCMRAYLHDSVLFVCVFMLRLTAKLGWLLVWGVNLGLGGLPASLSLCLLLFMCCRQQQKYH